MAAPRTRVGEGANEFERDLLRSWSHEKPTAGGRNRALGLVGGAAVGVTSSGTAAGAVAVAPKAATVSLAVVKWIVAGAFVVVGAIAAPHVLSRSVALSHVAASSIPFVPPIATPETQGHEPTVAQPDLTVAKSRIDDPQELSPLRSVAASPVSLTPVRVVTAPPLTPMTSSPVEAPSVSPLAPAPSMPAPSMTDGHASRALGDQVASIDRARAALAAGDPHEVVVQADDYEARFPRGSLLQEATVLRVEALLRLGERSRAQEAGDRFLAAYPTSPHAARVRKLLAPVQNP